MLIDTSALVAILLSEPEADALVAAILADDRRLIGAPSLVEAAAVLLAKKGPQSAIALDALLQRLGIVTVEMSATAATEARRGYERFGKGVGAPAVLNYGDCLSYGIALALDEPLLFKGDDFLRTDVAVVQYSKT